MFSHMNFLKIFHISAECYPIAKVGGLADVVGALPKYQNAVGARSSVIMPFYDLAYTKNNSFKNVFKGSIALGEIAYDFKIITPVENSLGFDLFLVDIPELLFTPFVYSNDDTNRFLAFQNCRIRLDGCAGRFARFSALPRSSYRLGSIYDVARR